MQNHFFVISSSIWMSFQVWQNATEVLPTPADPIHSDLHPRLRWPHNSKNDDLELAKVILLPQSLRPEIDLEVVKSLLTIQLWRDRGARDILLQKVLPEEDFGASVLRMVRNV